MAWTKETTNGFLVATETLTLPSAASTDVNSSSIDFAKKGSDFIVFANTGATDLTADGDVDVQVSFDGSTWATLKADLIASIDNTTAVAFFDVSAEGEAPYYRLTITNDGNQAAEEVVVKVVIP